MEDHMSQLRDNIKWFRSQLNISQEKLALRSGLCQQTINNIENGNAPIKTSSLLSIAQALDIHPRCFWSDRPAMELPVHTYNIEKAKIYEYRSPAEAPPIFYQLHDSQAFYSEYFRSNACQYTSCIFPMWHPALGYLNQYGILASKKGRENASIITCLNVSERECVAASLAETLNASDMSLSHLFDLLQDMKRGMYPPRT